MGPRARANPAAAGLCLYMQSDLCVCGLSLSLSLSFAFSFSFSFSFFLSLSLSPRASHAHSGYAAATFLAGVRGSNVGIFAGAATGVGIFFGLEAFEEWRLRTRRAMLEVAAPPPCPP